MLLYHPKNIIQFHIRMNIRQLDRTLAIYLLYIIFSLSHKYFVQSIIKDNIHENCSIRCEICAGVSVHNLMQSCVSQVPALCCVLLKWSSDMSVTHKPSQPNLTIGVNST